MVWFKKTDLKSEEYEAILKKIAILTSDVAQIEARLKALNTNYDDLRGKFNRKLGIIKKEQEEEEQATETEKYNKPFHPWI